MKENKLFMSLKEVKRLEIVKKIISKKLKQREGASILKISERQIRRLVKSYKESGESGLTSKKRGKASNRRISLDIETKITTLIFIFTIPIDYTINFKSTHIFLIYLYFIIFFLLNYKNRVGRILSEIFYPIL